MSFTTIHILFSNLCITIILLRSPVCNRRCWFHPNLAYHIMSNKSEVNILHNGADAVRKCKSISRRYDLSYCSTIKGGSRLPLGHMKERGLFLQLRTLKAHSGTYSEALFFRMYITGDHLVIRIAIWPAFESRRLGNMVSLTRATTEMILC